ncbi:hypothetical protein B7P43_G09400 [Cryptotermes secundus]|uniref:Uncharacterized protein n=1 Tax=Cryptotermes secundus TaxID=105785 RepID=A0A2J7R4T5_9NEOP|nr:hypothetical protein B7P43_G09400 [Cryptotermes secundus]
MYIQYTTTTIRTKWKPSIFSIDQIETVVYFIILAGYMTWAIRILCMQKYVFH